MNMISTLGTVLLVLCCAHVAPARAAPVGPPGPTPLPTCTLPPLVVSPPSGSVDRLFGCNGSRFTAAPDSTATSLIHYNARGALRLPDDRIVVVGNRRDVNANSSDTLVLRYTASGRLDTSFGSGGVQRINASGSSFGPEMAHAVLVQPDGKLLVVGTRSNEVFQTGYILRLQADGALDTGFGTAGSGITVLETIKEATDVVADGVGGFYVSGRSCDGGSFPPSCVTRLIRVSSGGAVDPGFGTTGTLLLSYAGGNETAQALAVSNGRLAVVGNTAYAFGFDDGNLGVARFLLTSGLASFDTSFSSDGRYTLGLGGTGSVHDVLLDSDGSMWIGGAGPAAGAPGVDRFSVTRLSAGGTMASRRTTTFPSTARGVLRSLARGKLRVYGAGAVETSTGVSRLAVAAYKTDGLLDTAFSTDGLVELSIAGQVARQGAVVLVQASGRVVLVSTQEPSAGSGFAIVLVGLVP